MRYCILMGSPHRTGNTSSVVSLFIEELNNKGEEVDLIWLYDKEIKPCTGCKTCQYKFDSFGCAINDDMQKVFQSVYDADYIVFATPIYSWYCTPPMKAALDRLVYAMNKYYGLEKGPCLWKGKKCLIITTCGYKPEKGADLFEEGIKRYCKHSNLNYTGMLAFRDYGQNSCFMNEERADQIRNFAHQLFQGNDKL